MKAMITDIKRFAVHDGDGIRTTVFFKGCPMRCLWCHNQEGLIRETQLAFYAHKCVGCGACAKTCAVHQVKEGKHLIDRAQCYFCGECIQACPQDALQIFGKEVTVQEVFAVVAQDMLFYQTSGGGVTLSGGEALLYPAFCAELLALCRQNGIPTAVDTCGYVSREALDAVIPYTDVFLYDLKALEEEVHLRCTGVSNRNILENLTYLDRQGCNIEIRIPYIPAYNDDQPAKLSAFVKTLHHVTKTRILPYHDYACSKYRALDMPFSMHKIRIPTETECKELEQMYF